MTTTAATTTPTTTTTTTTTSKAALESPQTFERGAGAGSRSPKPAWTKTQRHSGGNKRRRWVSRAISIVVGLLIIAAFGWAWRPKPIAVDLATVTRGDLLVTVEEVAKTRVRDRYVVAAPLGGNLLRVELKPGDTVQKGSIIARITPMEAPLLDPRSRASAASRSLAATAGERQAQAAVTRAEVASQHANDELERTRKLAASGSLAPDAVTRGSLEARLRTEELASARFAAQMAAHEAAMSRATLARFDGTTTAAGGGGAAAAAEDGFNVPAPVTGTVLRVMAQSAGPVQPGAPLLEVGDPTALEVVTDVLSADAVRIASGAKVTLERWGGSSVLQGHVRRVEPSGFTRLSALGVEEQRVPVIVDLDEPRERWTSLGDGFRVEARIVVDEKHGVLRAPVGAVFRHGDAWASYVALDADKDVGARARARLVTVALGARNDQLVEITSGLSEGASVVVHPGERVKEGAHLARRD